MKIITWKETNEQEETAENSRNNGLNNLSHLCKVTVFECLTWRHYSNAKTKPRRTGQALTAPDPAQQTRGGVIEITLKNTANRATPRSKDGAQEQHRTLRLRGSRDVGPSLSLTFVKFQSRVDIILRGVIVTDRLRFLLFWGNKSASFCLQRTFECQFCMWNSRTFLSYNIKMTWSF